MGIFLRHASYFVLTALRIQEINTGRVVRCVCQDAVNLQLKANNLLQQFTFYKTNFLH